MRRSRRHPQWCGLLAVFLVLACAERAEDGVRDPLESAGPEAASPGSPEGAGAPVDPPVAPPVAVHSEHLAAWFTDEAAERGLVARNHSGDPVKKRYLVENMGTGIALFDYDGDQDLDAYLTDGCTIHPPGEGPEPPAALAPPATSEDWRPAFDGASRLFRNDGSGRFEDVTEETGAGYAGFGFGANAADMDNDGDPDLYLTCWGPNRLLRNQEGRTFEDVTEAAGVGEPRWSVGSAFLDADLDGFLDLFVANYFALTTVRDPEFWVKVDCPYIDERMLVACGPKTMVAEPDTMYRNRGDGTFEEVSETCGIRSVEERYSLGAISFDADKDGDSDVYVANDSRGNYLFLSEGDGTFIEMADLAGVSLNASGVAQAGMGIGVGDFDADLDLDLHLTNFSLDDNTLYRNDRHLVFRDVTMRINFGQSIYYSLGWGTDFADFDNDGDMDLFVSNGHIYPEADVRAPEMVFRQHNRLFLAEDGAMRDATFESGPGLEKLSSSRGCAMGDIDRDGDVDVVVAEINEAPTLLVNGLSREAGHFVVVSVEGVKCNRDGVGAKVLVTVGEHGVLQEVRAGHSYASRNDPRLHFGLGAATRIDRLRIVWPGTKLRQDFVDLPVDRWYHLREGEEDLEVREWRR